MSFCARGKFWERDPTLIHPPSKCGRCVQQHIPSLERNLISINKMSDTGVHTSLAYLGHFSMTVSTLLQRYVVNIATNMEPLKRCFISRGNCNELEQMSQERQHRKLQQK
jgi:hypothetical protein